MIPQPTDPPAETPAYLGLGSNLGRREALLAEARALLEGPQLRVVAASSVYETPPWGRADQPWFLNQALQAFTTLSPRRLLERCREVESRLGRVRSTRWGPRTIDVDILLYDALEIAEPGLTVPHPELRHRAFVLVPLAELDPSLRIPGPAGGATVRALLDALPDRAGLRKYAPGTPAGGARDVAIIGRDLRRYESVSSTNDVALRLLAGTAPEGTIVVADEQTAGRGRRGRTWLSPRGGLWLSVILKPRLSRRHLPLVGFAAGIAAAEAIAETTGLVPRLKWPNDVLINGAKVVGVLVEATPEGAVIAGVGINANVPADALPATAGYPAASLEVLLGRPVDRESLLQAVLRAFDRQYQALQDAGPDAVLVRWRGLADTLGRRIQVEMPEATITGIALDIDERGALLVRLGDGTVRPVMAGDVRVREPDA